MAYAPVSKTGNAGSSPATFTKCLHVTRTRGDDPALSQLRFLKGIIPLRNIGGFRLQMKVVERNEDFLKVQTYCVIPSSSMEPPGITIGLAFQVPLD